MTKALDPLEWLPDQLDAVPAKRHLLVNLRENALTNQHDDSCFFTVYSSWESFRFCTYRVSQKKVSFVENCH